jgi:hypothetical protein
MDFAGGRMDRKMRGSRSAVAAIIATVVEGVLEEL